MNKTGIVIILLCFLAATAAVLWERRKIRKTMEEIERMLDAAMTGSFSETNFDESQLSALETKFAHYLSAAEASSRNVAQEKDKIKTLIADISHQTKTPITNLLLYSELLMEETLPASAKANVEALYKQSEKLRFLIDSLVKLSRLENGIISLAPQQAALQPLLESVVEQYTAKASEKGLSLQMQDTDAFAVFDFKWTAEALANIVDNAIKYTEHALPNQLSGGQQQRVAIARALAAAPAIILADEPTGNLDSKTSQDVLSLLKVTSQKFAQTIVMITHNEEIAQMADRISRIEDGRIVSRN